MKRGVVYARLSDVRKGDSEGIDRQLREARAHADRLDVEIVEELVDNDLSAAKARRRPAFDRLMAGIEANAWDVVVLRSLDRWVRRPAELEEIIETVERSKVQIEAIHGEIDLRTRQGRLAARLLTSVAMHEVETTVERVRDWHQDRAARGLPIQGPPGYGYRRPRGTVDVSVVPDEADRIREAARRVLDGEPLRAIARDYTDRDVPAPGDNWTGNLLRRILLAPRIAGLRVHRGQITPGAWAPILDRETFDRVGRLLTNPARNTNPVAGSRAPRLLTGLASCGKCGKPLNSKTDSKARRYYCRHCYGVIVFADRLDELVAEMAFDAVDDPKFRATLRRQETNVDDAAVADEILRLEQDLEELAAELGDGRLTMTEWKTARHGIDRRLVALRAEIQHDDSTAALGPYTAPGALRAAWQDPNGLTIPEKRAILAALFDTIRVDPARRGPNRFDPTRIHPTWRRPT